MFPEFDCSSSNRYALIPLPLPSWWLQNTSQRSDSAELLCSVDLVRISRTLTPEEEYMQEFLIEGKLKYSHAEDNLTVLLGERFYRHKNYQRIALYTRHAKSSRYNYTQRGALSIVGEEICSRK